MIQEVKNDLVKKESAKTALRVSIATKKDLLNEIKMRSGRMENNAGELGGSIAGKSTHLAKLVLELDQFDEYLDTFLNNEHEFCKNTINNSKILI